MEKYHLRERVKVAIFKRFQVLDFKFYIYIYIIFWAKHNSYTSLSRV